MSAPTTIRVTAGHIANGARHDPFHCPVALAVCEQGGYEPGDVVALYSEIRIPLGDHDAIATPGGDATYFMDAFDDGAPVEPFEFTVEWVDDDSAEVPL